MTYDVVARHRQGGVDFPKPFSNVEIDSNPALIRDSIANFSLATTAS